jgi:hypothetical protein
MNSVKLSARMTPNACASLSHRKTDARAAPTSPMCPKPAMGIRSPGAEMAAASMAASPASVTMTIGMTAAYSVMFIVGCSEPARSASPTVAYPE